MSKFEVIREYFSRQRCKECETPFQPGGIILLREDSTVMVVRVECVKCSKILGTAIIGSNSHRAVTQEMTVRQAKPKGMSNKDAKKFAKLGPITSDEILDFHRKLHG